MKILNRDELDEQRKNYMRYVGALNKLAQGVGDGTRKGEEVRDMTLILQTRFLTFILSELVQMSQILREMENQVEVDFLTEMEDQSEDEFEDLFEAKIEPEVSEDVPISEEIREAEEADEGGWGTAELLSTLAEIDADGQADVGKIVDDIHEQAGESEDEEED
jgi:hypothetical protein